MRTRTHLIASTRIKILVKNHFPYKLVSQPRKIKNGGWRGVGEGKGGDKWKGMREKRDRKKKKGERDGHGVGGALYTET